MRRLGLMDQDATEALRLDHEQAERVFDLTLGFWRRWLAKCTYKGRWREMVDRSVLTLKLLTFAPTGALVAAPTCSLPEVIGGARNWDYRYTWLRDAAFTLYAFMRVGLTEEAGQFMHWIEARANELSEEDTPDIMYSLDGSHVVEEETLDHLEGYQKSQPVRVGNAAHHQLQLDIYGELMDAVYLYNKYGSPISYDFWSHLRKLVNWVAANWHQPDEGIWEVRGGRQHFVFSSSCAGRARPRVKTGRQTLLPGRPSRLAPGARCYLRDNHGAWMEPGPQGFRPVPRLRRVGCCQPSDAVGLLHVANGPAHALDHRRRLHRSDQR